MIQKNYFVLNKAADFRKGYGENIEPGLNGINLKKGCLNGIYYTKVFDSREKGNEWHRLKIFGSFYGEASAQVTVYAAESLSPGVSDCEITIPEIIKSMELPEEEKNRLLSPYEQVVFYQPEDVLLHKVKGRYLWMKIMLANQGGKSPRIGRMQIYFPKQTWLSYLPEIYQQDIKSVSFLERYLGVFQSLYDDMTEKIIEVSELFSASSADRIRLLHLAEWFGIEHLAIWNEEQLRYLVLNAVRISQSRGTAAYIKELVWLYSGVTSWLIEFHKIRPYFGESGSGEHLKKLYGENPYVFTLLLHVSEEKKTYSIQELRQVIDLAKPAHMECRIVLLKSYIFLDQYSYLGQNSVLGQYKVLTLDGKCAVPFSVIRE